MIEGGLHSEHKGIFEPPSERERRLSLLLFHNPVEDQAHYYGSSNYTTEKCLNPIFHTSSFYSLIDLCHCFHIIHFLSARIYRRARCSGFRSYFLLVKIVTIQYPTQAITPTISMISIVYLLIDGRQRTSYLIPDLQPHFPYRHISLNCGPVRLL